MKLYLNSINLGTDGLGPDFDGHTKYFLTKFATDAELLLEIQRINPPGYLIPYMPVEPDVSRPPDKGIVRKSDGFPAHLDIDWSYMRA